MSNRHLPPLNPLRHFEAAARCGSFTRAAEELHVTTVAVSRQVAKLEHYFGIPLFVRLHQKIQLTRAGEEFLPKASAALDLINDGSRRLREHPGEPIVVCAYPVLAIRWLIPRLPAFHAQHPDVTISIASAIKPAEFDYHVIDVGMQYIHDAPPSLAAEVIIPDIIQPVCGPDLLRHSDHPLPPAANLTHYTLLRSRYRRRDWAEWLEVAGGPYIEPMQYMTFRGAELAYQAAIEGLGIVVAQRLLVEDEIAKGNLIAPFSVAVQRAGGICMVCRRKSMNDSRVIAFSSWVKQEAAHAMRALGVNIVSAVPNGVVPVPLAALPSLKPENS